MSILNYISGPIVGAVIGYFTNYIAVKMLFRPYDPIKIGRFTLPFTPGIIPKRKGDIAVAIGNAVGKSLLTPDDIDKMLCSDEVEDAAVSAVASEIMKLNCDNTLREVLLKFTDEENLVKLKTGICDKASEKITSRMVEMKLGSTLAEQVGAAVKNELSGMLFGGILSSGVDKYVAPVGSRINKYIESNGKDIISKEVGGFEDELLNMSMSQIFSEAHITEESVSNVLKNLYERYLIGSISKVAENIDIAKIVRDKIDEMSIAELEELVMSVMKKELGAIVNLGALIGLVIGVINIFV